MPTTSTRCAINQFGSSFHLLAEPRSIFDPASGCHLVLATPRCAPELWMSYLRGARDVYSAHGVTAAFDHDAVVDGASTTLFYAAVDGAGVVRGGHRAQGPYRDVHESHAPVEWEGNGGRDVLIEAVASRLRHGIVEMKSAWVDPTAGDPSAVSAMLARVAVPTIAVTGARFIMATAAEHVLRRWSSSGGRVDNQVPASAYPDERYRTSLMWWDRETIEELAEPAVWRQMCAESHEWAGDVSGNRSVA